MIPTCKNCLLWGEINDYGFCDEKETETPKDSYCPRWVYNPMAGKIQEDEAEEES